MQVCTIRLIPAKLGVSSMNLKGHKLSETPTEVPAEIAGLAVRDFGAGVEVVKGTPVAPAAPLSTEQRTQIARALRTGDLGQLVQATKGANGGEIPPLSEAVKALLLDTKKGAAARLSEAVAAGALDAELDVAMLVARLLSLTEALAVLQARRG